MRRIFCALAVLALSACDEGAQTYAVGGVVTGLRSTAQLTLLNNGANPQLVAANGSYQLTSSLNYNAAYDVTIGTQPLGQTCSVANGSGSATGNIANANISCVAASESVVWSFGGTPDGTRPQSILVPGPNGNLYGTTYQGGANNKGMVYSITPAGTQTVLWSFAGGATDGANADARLVLASDGNFYSTTQFGGQYDAGTFYKLTPAGVLTVLWSFGGTGDGAMPQENIIQAQDGNFYGITYFGGANGKGAIFKLTPAGVETVMWSFGGTVADGAKPYAGITEGSDGSFYGTTSLGGSNNVGTVFKMTPSGSFSTLHTFGGTDDGAGPTSRLLEGSDGNFYGVTSDGGKFQGGTLFKISPSGSESVLWAFGGSNDGQFPIGQLLLGRDGNFYGTTQNGGTQGLGTMYSVSASGIENVLWSFGATGDGSEPITGLFLASDGHFYGTTMFGGAYGHGTVFRY